MRAMLDYEPSETRKEFERGDIVRVVHPEKDPPLSTAVSVGDQGAVEYASSIGPIQVLFPGCSPHGRTWLRQFVNRGAIERTKPDA